MRLCINIFYFQCKKMLSVHCMIFSLIIINIIVIIILII